MDKRKLVSILLASLLIMTVTVAAVSAREGRTTSITSARISNVDQTIKDTSSTANGGVYFAATSSGTTNINGGELPTTSVAVGGANILNQDVSGCCPGSCCPS